MGKKTSPPIIAPKIFNVFKPAGMSSQKLVHLFKKNLPDGYGKIGHFGTLDPFACGVFLIAVAGATRLNDFIHAHHPKTYLAIGKLGEKTNTGDCEGEVIQKDSSSYLINQISQFDTGFLTKTLNEKFLGDYWQAPPAFSAAKFEGKPLHYWARQGIEIKKDLVLRKVLKIEVVKFSFPYLSLRIEVSSGTYIRTLFEDMAQWLGTLGHLKGLQRESIGHFNVKNTLRKSSWPQNEGCLSFYNKAMDIKDCLPFKSLFLSNEESQLILNGGEFTYSEELEDQHYWLFNHEKRLISLGEKSANKIKPYLNFPQIV